MKLKILALDDVPLTKKPIMAMFQREGVDVDIDMHTPSEVDEIYPFSDDFPTSQNIKEYDFAFIDLELNMGKLFQPLHFHPDDYEGGTKILPHLRKIAPWLPVIGYSRLFEKEGDSGSNSLFALGASTFRFDATLSRNDFTNTKLNREWVDLLLEKANHNRILSCMGILSNRKLEKCEVKISESLLKEFESLSNDFINTFELAFHFAKEITIEKFTQGFSGSIVLKIFAKLSDKLGSEESEWIVKLNKNPSLLHDELVAHKRMSRKGISHAMMVPLLWPNVIFCNKLAVIGYQFAGGFLPMSKIISNLPNMDGIEKVFKKDFGEFYSKKQDNRGPLANIINQYFPKIKNETLKLLENEKLKSLFDDLEQNNLNSFLDKAIIYKSCIIHGDLHCDNIMISDSNTLFIDFAHSTHAPVVVDISKLFIDIITRNKEYQSEKLKILTNEGLQGKLVKTMKKNFKFNMKSNDDRLLLTIAIIFQSIKYLEYEDITDEAKRYLIDFLNTIDIFE